MYMVMEVVEVNERHSQYLNQKQAIKVDEELMGDLGFTLEQLMELAGAC